MVNQGIIIIVATEHSLHGNNANYEVRRLCWKLTMYFHTAGDSPTVMSSSESSSGSGGSPISSRKGSSVSTNL